MTVVGTSIDHRRKRLLRDADLAVDERAPEHGLDLVLGQAGLAQDLRWETVARGRLRGVGRRADEDPAVAVEREPRDPGHHRLHHHEAALLADPEDDVGGAGRVVDVIRVRGRRAAADRLGPAHRSRERRPSRHRRRRARRGRRRRARAGVAASAWGRDARNGGRVPCPARATIVAWPETCTDPSARPGSSTPSAPRSGATAAPSPPSAPTTSPRSSSARSSTGPASTPGSSRTSSSAAPTRPARTTGTSRGWPRCSPGCRSRSPARPSTGCAGRGSRR